MRLPPSRDPSRSQRVSRRLALLGPGPAAIYADALSLAFTPSFTLRAASTLLPLRPGELRSQVLEFVRAQPDVEFSPTTVARSLEASSGAVSNTLERLV
jgi:hypothetical protein